MEQNDRRMSELKANVAAQLKALSQELEGTHPPSALQYLNRCLTFIVVLCSVAWQS